MRAPAPTAPPPSGLRLRPRHAAIVQTGLGAGLAALLLYAATCGRGVEWQDSGIHQYRVMTGLLDHPVGLALCHPLHYWLGRVLLHVPLGTLPFRMNLLSAFCGALAVGVVAGLVIRVTGSRLAAGIAAASLALAHSFWQMSAVTETYTLAAALMTVEWIMLWRYVRTSQPLWLVAVFAVNGLHVSDHLLGLLPLSTYGILLLVHWARRRLSVRTVAAAAAAWFITAAPYWTLVVGHGLASGDWPGTLRSALFGGDGERDYSGAVLNTHISIAQIKLAVLAYGYCFPSGALLVALLGVVRTLRGRRQLFRRILLAQTAILVLFVGRYGIKDVYTYYVPVCVATAFWIGCGAAWLQARWRAPAVRRRITIALCVNALLPLVVYLVFPVLAEQHGWMRAQLRHIPFRNEYDHFFRPWRFLDHSAAQFADAAITAAGPDGWVLADSTTSFPVATTCLMRSPAPVARVYWTTRRCLLPPGGSQLSNEALQSFVRGGGRLVTAPTDEVIPIVQPALRIIESEPLWQIVAPPNE